MAVEVTGKYLGNKRVELVHGPSGSVICTDAPKDNNGEGAYFSPTDLVAAGLGSCVLTIMGILAERHDIDLSDSSFKVEKHMTNDPRRIGKLVVELLLPEGINADQRKMLERAAHTCPVHRSLGEDVEVDIRFSYSLS